MRTTLAQLLLLSTLSMAGLGGKLLPIPVVFSYPETGPGGGAKLRWQNPLDLPGFADITAYMTARGQSNLELEVERDSLLGVWRLGAFAEVGKFPGKWYGPGNPPPDDLAGVYTPIYLGGKVSVGRWLPSGWLVGAQLEVEQTNIRTDRLGIFNQANWTGMQGGLETNVGILLQHEGRDLPENPRSGSFLAFRAQASVPGTDFSTQNIQVEASQAASLGGVTAVVRGHYEEAWGSMPFWKLPFLGYRKSLRGLPDKRLRGNVAQCLGAEVRYQELRVVLYPTTGSSGISIEVQPALFGELGRAGGHTEVWTSDVNWAAGAGVRLPLAGGKAVLRVDYGWSALGQGLYVDFGQAF